MTGALLPNQCEIGVVGLGTDGRKWVRALADKRLNVAALESNASEAASLHLTSVGLVRLAEDVPHFRALLHAPRIVLLTGTDEANDQFLNVIQHLEPDDFVIDATDTHFMECARRTQRLADQQVRYMGLSTLSGTETALIAGGRADVLKKLQWVMEALASSEDGEATINHIGAASAEHFIHAIHCGMGHAFKQLFWEFETLSGAAGVATELKFGRSTPLSPSREARWTTLAARDAMVACPLLDSAAGMRIPTEFDKQNNFLSTPYRHPAGLMREDSEHVTAELKGALQAAMLIAAAESVAVLRGAAEIYGFLLDVKQILELWANDGTEGANLFRDIAFALDASPELSDVLQDDDLSETLMELQEYLRQAVWRGHQLKLHLPTLTAALDHLDCGRGPWLPANLIQVA